MYILIPLHDILFYEVENIIIKIIDFINLKINYNVFYIIILVYQVDDYIFHVLF